MLTSIHVKHVVLTWALDFILKARTMMTNVDGSNSNSKARDDCNLECEVAKVEIGDTIVVITNAMENGDPF